MSRRQGPISLRSFWVNSENTCNGLICESSKWAHQRRQQGGPGAILSTSQGDGWEAKCVTSEPLSCGIQQPRVKWSTARDPHLPLYCQPQWSAPRTWSSSERGVYAARGEQRESEAGKTSKLDEEQRGRKCGEPRGEESGGERREEKRKNIRRTHLTMALWKGQPNFSRWTLNAAFHLSNTPHKRRQEQRISTKQSATLHAWPDNSR